jgi:hypothetical protein
MGDTALITSAMSNWMGNMAAMEPQHLLVAHAMNGVQAMTLSQRLVATGLTFTTKWTAGTELGPAWSL